MRRYAIINTCDWGSTGKIAIGLQRYLESKKNSVIFCYGYGSPSNSANKYRIDNVVDHSFHSIRRILTGRLCAGSYFATKRLIKMLAKRNVEGIFLINMHGSYLNEELFFNYAIEYKIKIVYIMADESAYLGNCTYRNGCNNYMNGCRECPKLTHIQRIVSPLSPRKAFQIKANAYKKLQAAFVAPEFVVKSAKESPLMVDKNVYIVDEAIDVEINKPVDTRDLRDQLGIPHDKIVIVCVAPYPSPRKGGEFFIKAAQELENEHEFVFVHVGYMMEDKSNLPSNYIAKGFVNNQCELVKYYSLADLFVFPSLHDTMPNTCLEALACGSPLLCFNTSGMPYIGDQSVLQLVDPLNIKQLVEAIRNTSKKSQLTINICRNYALKRYDVRLYSKRLEEIMINL